MIWYIGVCGTYYTNIIDIGGCVWKNFTNFDSTFTVLPKFEWRCICIAGCPLCLKVFDRQRLAVIFVQKWLRIECIYVGKPTVQKDVDNVFCNRLVMRLFA